MSSLAVGRTARYNPLGHIRGDDPIEVLDGLQKLAVMLFPAPPGADPFWAEAARTGSIGVGPFIAETPGRPFNLGAIYAEFTRGEASPGWAPRPPSAPSKAGHCPPAAPTRSPTSPQPRRTPLPRSSRPSPAG
jgi:type IV secretion system protein VirD4